MVVPRTYLEFTNGDYPAALVLREAVFWTTYYLDHPVKAGWWYRTEGEWQDQLYLSRKQVNRAVAAVNTTAGGTLIEKAVRKIRTDAGAVLSETASHYRLDTELYETLFSGAGGGRSRNGPLGSSGAGSSGSSGNGPLGKSFTEAQPTHTTNEHISSSAGADTRPSISSAELFELFWRRYPKGRGSKKASRGQWDRLRVDAGLYEAIVAGLEVWELSHEWRDPQYIRHCERWLRDRMWENPPAPTGPPRLQGAGSTKHHNIDNFQRKWGIGPYAAGAPVGDGDVIDVEGGPR